MMPSKKERIAFAIFVKTPGLSALKTRLASAVGRDKANDFYLLSLDKIRNDLSSLQKEQDKYDIDCFWAVAESRNDRHAQFWSEFPLLYQPQEDLGGRIHAIYSLLVSQNYDKVVLMGADSPHFNQSDYLSWCGKDVKGSQVSIGPTLDGGFYCFIGKHALDKQIWTSVSYSQSTTLQELAISLNSAQININYLSSSFDIDEGADLQELKEYFAKNKSPYLLPAERRLLDFVGEL